MTNDKQASEFDFGSLELLEFPVVGLDGKKYILREASAEAVSMFNSARATCLKMKDGGVTGAEGIGHLEILLVRLCLWNTLEDGSVNVNAPIAPIIVKKWPERIVKKLFNRAKEISEIDDPADLNSLKEQREELDKKITKLEEDAAKNVPSDTETGLISPENEDTSVLSET